MKVPLSDTEVHDRGDFKAHFYVTKDDSKGFSALLVECVRRHYKTRLSRASRAYVVVEGSGTFTVNGKKESAQQYDFFFVGEGDVYEYEGKIKLLEFNFPATDASNEEKLD
jgi:mannose-6-phosphate isomerase-like protein (cupin superfamily)